MSMNAIIITTEIVIFAVLALSTYYSVKEKNRAQESEKQAIEQKEQLEKKWELSKDLTEKAIKDIDAILEEKDVCKVEVEKESITDASGWYSERIPDGVRNILIECACNANETNSYPVQSAECAGDAGDK